MRPFRVALVSLLTIGVFAVPAKADVQAAAFNHPGVLVSLAQLDTARSRVNAGRQPWKGAYDAMRASSPAKS